MNIKYLLILIVFTICGCRTTTFNTSANNEYIESVDSLNSNNELYAVGTEILYEYFFIHGKDSLKCQVLAEDPWYESDWTLVNKNDTLGKLSVIDKIRMIVLDETIANQQTTMQYDVLNSSLIDMPNAVTWTGVIENNLRIWKHPLRIYQFNILQYSPFPSVHFPLKVGNQWDYTLETACREGLKEWVECEVIHCKSTYEIVRKEKLKTPLGMLNCYVIESEAISELTKSNLTAYFHKKYGFVKFEYLNIDGNRLVIEVIDFKSPEAN